MFNSVFTTINGVYYYYEVAGSGRPLLLLHGFTGSSATWQPFTVHNSQFTIHNSQFIIPDLLGHGQTDVPDDPQRYRMEEAAADLALLIPQITPEPVHLLGYSMGGRLALYLAVHYPALVRSLILESSSPGLASAAERTARQQQDNQLADRIEREGIEAFVAFWEQLPLWQSQSADLKAQLRAQRLQNRPQGLTNSLRGMGTGVQPSLWPYLSDLAMPVLLLAGELDTKFVAINQQMAESILQAKLVIIPAAGHTIHAERPLHMATEIESFLKYR